MDNIALSTTTNTGEWYHLCGVYDGTAGKLSLYLNGQSDTTPVDHSGGIYDTGYSFRIGDNGQLQDPFTGLIDDVRVYNRVLTAQEIQDTYNWSGSNVPPPADTTAPTVSITSPTDGETVTGSITITADATDNVGVEGVQFQLDGVNLGSEDQTSPYSISWDTTTATDGSRTPTAIARDAAGNITTSSGVTVTVSNTTTDTESPTTPQNLTATAVSSSRIDLSWTASTDNVGVTNYRLEHCPGGSAMPTLFSLCGATCYRGRAELAYPIPE